VAVLEARRPQARAPWEFPALRLEFDKEAVDQRAAERQASMLARYGAAAVEAGAKAAAAAAASSAPDSASAPAPPAPAAVAASDGAGDRPILPATVTDPEAPEVLVITLA